MNELYSYLSDIRDDMYLTGKKTVEIDMEHFFKIHRTVCYMLQIKSIINFEDAMELAQGEGDLDARP